MSAKPNRYAQALEHIFKAKFKRGARSFEFHRDEFKAACLKLGIKEPDNIGDIVYSFRYRVELPESIKKAAPTSTLWIIMPGGKGIYRFEAVKQARLHPATGRAVIKVLDSTPGIISANAQSDEQALLAKLRYNRLIDTFLRITCYSLQNHLRTTVLGMGQIEVDEVYLGIDRNGAQYIVPVQAKGGKDFHSAVQIRQDIALCNEKFEQFLCRPIGAQFIGDVIALMEFRFHEGEIEVVNEQHYKLVLANELSGEEMARYRQASASDSS